jgi:hypothetical protein
MDASPLRQPFITSSYKRNISTFKRIAEYRLNITTPLNLQKLFMPEEMQLRSWGSPKVTSLAHTIVLALVIELGTWNQSCTLSSTI